MMDPIERRLDSMEREIKYMGERSNERLEFIRERFDKLDARIEKVLAGRTRVVVATYSIFLALCTGAYYTIVEPIQMEMAVLDRRILDVEKRIDWDRPVPEPE